MKREDLFWIDGFIKEIRPYIYVREEDSLLILIPNQAHKLNRTGLLMLMRLLGGASVADIMKDAPDSDEARRQIHAFFCDLRAAVMGCLRENSGRLAVEEVEYKPPLNTLPILSEIALTYQCNLHCQFCYAGGLSPRYPEIDTPSLEKMIDIIYHEAKVPSVSFTGGEPTLRNDLEALISHAVRTGLRINLITNATLIDEKTACLLKDAGLHSAQVSLEASNATLHDRLTGVAGSFEKTLRGIEFLRAAGITTHTNTTLNALNAPDAANGFIPFLKSLGLDRFSMNLMIPCGMATCHRGELGLKYMQLPPLLRAIKIKARDAGLRFMWYSPTPYCIFNPIAEGLGNKSCAACDGLLSIAPDGSILPCSSYDEPVGNLLSESFAKLWRGKKSRFFKKRKYMPRECRGCEHTDICAGACPLYWQTEGTAELKNGK